MYLMHFGLKHALLGKDSPELWDDGLLGLLSERFEWLLNSPGIGLLTADSGVGKTVALRHLRHKVNPHRHKVIYLAETDFGRLDIYRSLAIGLGFDPPHRRAQLWREITARIVDLADNKQIVPVWIIDEALNLPAEFFRDFPSFMNFAIDSRDLLTVWLVGHPSLARTLERASHAALFSRIQVHLHLRPITERERFMSLIHHAFKTAWPGRILQMGLQMAAAQKLNHLPDDLLRQAIEDFLLILDPFVRLHRIDENASGEVAPLLAYLRELQRRYALSVIVARHAKKGGGKIRAGQALRGSSEFHAWGDSNLYLRRTEQDLTLTIEHRAAPSLAPITLELIERDIALALEVRAGGVVVVAPNAPPSLEERIKETLANAGGQLQITDLRARCRVRNATLHERLRAMLRAGRLLRDAQGYRLART